MKNRNKQRENRKLKVEEGVSKYNLCGYKELTAYNAVERIRTNGKSSIALR